MPKFNIDSAGDNRPRVEQRWVWLNQIEPDEFNDEIYSIAGVEALADDIKLNGLLQFPLVRYMPGGKYMIISGHRRVAAIRLLVKEDPEQWKMIPVILDPDKDDTSAHIKLISANAVNRELSQGEIMKQTLKMYSLLTEQKEKENLPGRVRDMVAKKLNMSAGAVGEYMAIEQNLVFHLKEEFLKGEISKAVAVELSKLITSDQVEWWNRIRAGEKVTADGVRQYRRQLEAKAQDNVPNAPDNVQDNVSESDTQAEVMDNSQETTYFEEKVMDNPPENNDFEVKDNVSESDTQAEVIDNSPKTTYFEEKVMDNPPESNDLEVKEDVSESDTQEQPTKGHDLEWYKDMMRKAVLDIAVACAKIRKYSSSGTDCDYCPLYSCNSCTLTDTAPKNITYMFKARRTDDELNKLFQEV